MGRLPLSPAMTVMGWIATLVMAGASLTLLIA
jgi:hypothetical protein